MIVKQIIDEDFINYKVPSMLISFPRCSWKCGKELCHNTELEHLPDIELSIEAIIQRYISNPISKAIVFSGLEPFDSYNDLLTLAQKFREVTSDLIVIYTGYTEEEAAMYRELYEISNLIIKFGGYIPGHQPHYEAVLGVNLSSGNQYAKHINHLGDQ